MIGKITKSDSENNDFYTLLVQIISMQYGFFQLHSLTQAKALNGFAKT